MNTSELATALQQALTEAATAHAKLEEAQQKLSPLMEVVREKDSNVHRLMSEYQRQTGATPEPETKRRSSSGAKRAPRSLLAVLSTSAQRNLGAAHKAGTTRKVAVNGALDQIRLIAEKRGETVTPEIEKMVLEKANLLWAK